MRNKKAFFSLLKKYLGFGCIAALLQRLLGLFIDGTEVGFVCVFGVATVLAFAYLSRLNPIHRYRLLPLQLPFAHCFCCVWSLLCCRCTLLTVCAVHWMHTLWVLLSAPSSVAATR